MAKSETKDAFYVCFPCQGAVLMAIGNHKFDVFWVCQTWGWDWDCPRNGSRVYFHIGLSHQMGKLVLTHAHWHMGDHDKERLYIGVLLVVSEAC